ncbi:uncharacterized protein GIQ15_03127 [Arthroderma uncinatum]|uniref:uncharacterized protein n=1 Tax=Arthroderma uncinatum TaxID=74035 RepID=UPI00144AD498|nr:uncharacterized protein GIQ15_03127 [Arthroderma uncinatum]KAF3483803.1 hypothetical protein GIQ15_03127 [Arthroderma uncinatum]
MDPRETTVAVSPRVALQNDLSPGQACKRFSTPLVVIACAAARTRSDLWLFRRKCREYPEILSDGLVRRFSESICHKIFMLRGVYIGYKATVEQYRNEIAVAKLFRGAAPSLGDLLDTAEASVSNLEAEWHYSRLELGSPFLLVSFVAEGHMVPTRSSREILLQLILGRKTFRDRLSSTNPANFLGNIGDRVDLPFEPLQQADIVKLALKKPVADGSIKMLFVCYHDIPSNQSRRMVVGANQENWEGLKEIGDIRRRDRDYRLEPYIPRAWAAYKALRDHEIQEAGAINHKDYSTLQLGALRVRLAEDMRGHPSFLGRRNEHGQAFTTGGESHPCCYVCSGMMGYRVHMAWDRQRERLYFGSFDFKRRGDYPHSCAEVAASQQCAMYLVKNGLHEKY